MRFLCNIPIIGGFFRPMFYPIFVEVYEKSGNAIIKKIDYGQRKKVKGGYEQFSLLNENVTIEPPKFEEYMITRKGNPVLMLFKATSGDFKTVSPVTIKTVRIMRDPKTDQESEKELDGLQLSVTDKNVLFWNVQEQRKNRERYFKLKWYEIYAPYIALAVISLVLGIMVLMVSKELKSMADSLNGVAANVKEASNLISQAVKDVITKPPA